MLSARLCERLYAQVSRHLHTGAHVHGRAWTRDRGNHAGTATRGWVVAVTGHLNQTRPGPRRHEPRGSLRLAGRLAARSSRRTRLCRRPPRDRKAKSLDRRGQDCRGPCATVPSIVARLPRSSDRGSARSNARDGDRTCPRGVAGRFATAAEPADQRRSAGGSGALPARRRGRRGVGRGPTTAGAARRDQANAHDRRQSRLEQHEPVGQLPVRRRGEVLHRTG